MEQFFALTWVFGAAIIASQALSQELTGGVALVAIVSGCAAAIFTAKTRAERNALMTEVGVQRGAAEAWKTERDAEMARAERLALDLRNESAARIVAEARTDITRIEKQAVENNAQALSNHHDVLTLVAGLQSLLEQIAQNTAHST